ncbi:MAG: type III pantothenate kinase [Bacteroidia bacterium]|nr:type III pantothenate kinase [Bacteroidia bacterium]
MEGPLFCIDVGNSTVKVAQFSPAGEMLGLEPIEEPEQLLSLTGKRVVYIDTRLEPHWRARLAEIGAEELSLSRGVPFVSDYTLQLGPDRAAQIIAVWESGKFPAVILSLGTACTIDYIDAGGRHRGGTITAGIHLRLRALKEGTGRLPWVEPQKRAPQLGTNTEEAIIAGVVGGFRLELRARLESLRKQYGDFSIWVTGGEVELVKDELPADAIFAPELTLRGVWLWQRFLHTSGGSSLSIL